MPAVDDYRARSTPVALVNLSAMKEERRRGDQGANEDTNKEEENSASSSFTETAARHRSGDVVIDSHGTH